MLKIEGISKKIHKKQVLKDLSFSVPKGSIYTLVAGYGEGKTTLLNIIAGYTKADKGNIYINDVECGVNSYKSKKLFGFVPDNFPMYDELSAKEYLEFFGKMMSSNDDEQIRHLAINLLDFVGLDNCVDVRIKKFDYAKRQKLSIARALIHNPKLIILDEPFYGLDVKHVKEIKEIIDFLHDQGRTIFMTSDNLNLSASVSTAIGIMESGSMISGEKMRRAYETLVSNTKMKNITVRNDMIREVTKSVVTENEMDEFTYEEEMHQMPDLSHMQGVNPHHTQNIDLSHTMHQMPDLSHTQGVNLHYTQNIDLSHTMHQMPDLSHTQGVNLHHTQNIDLSRTMHQMPDLSHTQGANLYHTQNIDLSHTLHNMPQISDPIRMPQSEIQKIHNSRNSGNLDERVHKSNRLNIEKRGAGGSRVVTSKENMRKNQSRSDHR